MTMQRRKFIKAGTMAALFAGVPLKALAQSDAATRAPQAPIPASEIPYASRQDGAFYLQKSTFTPYLNTKFRARAADGKTLILTLVAVNDLGHYSKKKRNLNHLGRNGFSLVFAGTRRQPPAQDVYTIENDALAPLPLLLTPVYTKDAKNLRYEVIINRL